jgi:molybdopterin-guanine dinucleotide biosynthesis protein A
MPLVTSAIYQALADAGGIGAYARTALGVEPLVAVLSKDVQTQVQSALLASSIPRTHTVFDAAGARPVDFADASAFANVNTPTDLARIEAALRV